jgi:hypothetical protein
MKDKKTQAGNAQAWGETVAALSDVRELKEAAVAELGRGLSEEAVRANILSRARQNRLIGIQLLVPGFSRTVRRLSWTSFVHKLADYYTRGSRIRKVQGAVNRASELIGWDEWFADFVLDWAKTGKPGMLSESYIGKTGHCDIGPKDDRTRLVFLVAGPLSDLDDLIEQLRREHRAAYPNYQRRDDRELMARRCRQSADGMTDRQIAQAELLEEGFDLRAADDAEFKQELDLRTNAVKLSRHNWKKDVTQITGPV